MRTFESLSISKYSKVSPTMKRWHKRSKSRAERYHGKDFIKYIYSQTNREDYVYKYNPSRTKGWAD